MAVLLKAHALHPALMELCLSFYARTADWMVQQVVQESSTTVVPDQVATHTTTSVCVCCYVAVFTCHKCVLIPTLLKCVLLCCRIHCYKCVLIPTRHKCVAMLPRSLAISVCVDTHLPQVKLSYLPTTSVCVCVLLCCHTHTPQVCVLPCCLCVCPCCSLLPLSTSFLSVWSRTCQIWCWLSSTCTSLLWLGCVMCAHLLALFRQMDSQLTLMPHHVDSYVAFCTIYMKYVIGLGTCLLWDSFLKCAGVPVLSITLTSGQNLPS